MSHPLFRVEYTVSSVITIFAALCFAFWVSACQNSASGEGEDPVAPTVDTLLYSIKKVQLRQPDCADTSRCASVDASYAVFTGDSPLCEKVNALIKDLLIGAVAAYGSNNPDGLETTDLSIEAAADSFFKQHAEYVKEFPDGIGAGWTIDFAGNVLRNDTQMLVLEVNEYWYTGGAHGNYASGFFNYDHNTGKEITMDALIADKAALLQQVEAQIREKFEVPENKSLADAGFFVEEGLPMPSNFAILPDSVYFHYNVYELGPYAMGPVFVTLAKSDLGSAYFEQ